MCFTSLFTTTKSGDSSEGICTKRYKRGKKYAQIIMEKINFLHCNELNVSKMKTYSQACYRVCKNFHGSLIFVVAFNHKIKPTKIKAPHKFHG